MLDRYLSLELYIPMALRELKKNRVNSLSAEESEILTDILPIMKPFAKVIGDISGDKYPTCSIIIPIVNCLELTINKIHPCTDVGKEFKANVIKNMKEKLFHVEKVPSLSIATLLDPRFKKLHFHQMQAAADAVRSIDRELKKQKPAQSTHKKLVEIGEGDDIWKAHDSLLVQHQDRVTTIRDSDLDEELKHCLKLPLLPRQANHLQYWQSKGAQFPKLAKLAFKKLANLATTVPSERQFSKAGLIDTPNRSQLTDMHLNMLVFLTSCTKEEWGIS
ncbi:E3 SUMO-protein ligase ZBED1-like [Phymastichus coffea]|uniref:E3 SUMO-protein ligase ZBED1-like n=1 Tax=Phymastichus coffea TaxID=108790 RepID=UPI00273CA19E|nr:E3 SUMO-protein ligase ZBED1-like [Phymastichus coffea]